MSWLHVIDFTDVMLLQENKKMLHRNINHIKWYKNLVCLRILLKYELKKAFCFNFVSIMRLPMYPFLNVAYSGDVDGHFFCFQQGLFVFFYSFQEFKTSGSSNIDTSKVTGTLETKYKWAEYGLTFTEKWTTENTLGTEVCVEDQVRWKLCYGSSHNWNSSELIVIYGMTFFRSPKAWNSHLTLHFHQILGKLLFLLLGLGIFSQTTTCWPHLNKFTARRAARSRQLIKGNTWMQELM